VSKSKLHRPFIGLTWPQLEVIRDVALGYRSSQTRGRGARAFWSLSSKKIPLIEKTKNGHCLTSTGGDVFLLMQQWRPDLYAKRGV
jgi:hypothetical protein